MSIGKILWTWNFFSRFQRKDFPILGHIEFFRKKQGLSLLQIPFFSARQIFVFRVPQHQMLRGQFFLPDGRRPETVLWCFFVRDGNRFPLFIEAEGLVKRASLFPGRPDTGVSGQGFIPGEGQAQARFSVLAEKAETVFALVERNIIKGKNGCPESPLCSPSSRI